MSVPELKCAWDAGHWRLSGVAERGNLAVLACLHVSPPDAVSPVVLDLSDLDIADSAALIALVDAIRALAGSAHVRIRSAPQLLGHTLYRLGVLDGAITLEDMREDEAYS